MKYTIILSKKREYPASLLLSSSPNRLDIEPNRLDIEQAKFYEIARPRSDKFRLPLTSRNLRAVFVLAGLLALDVYPNLPSSRR